MQRASSSAGLDMSAKVRSWDKDFRAISAAKIRAVEPIPTELKHVKIYNSYAKIQPIADCNNHSETKRRCVNAESS